MAKSLTARLGLQRWSADTDTQERAEFDAGHGKLDDLAAMDMQGTLANRPAAVAGNRGLYYYVTGDATAANNDRLYRSTGAGWFEVLTEPRASAAYEPRVELIEQRINTQETTTSTAPTSLATIGPTVNIVVPASGRLAVDFSCSAWNSGANFSYVAVDVFRTSDNVLLFNTDQQKGLIVPGTMETRAGVHDLFTGLPPGEQVTVRMRYWVNTGTGTFRRRHLAVHKTT